MNLETRLYHRLLRLVDKLFDECYNMDLKVETQLLGIKSSREKTLLVRVYNTRLKQVEAEYKQAKQFLKSGLYE